MEEFQKKYYRKAQFYKFYTPNGRLPDVNANMSYRDTIHLEKVLENAAKKREKMLDILKQRVKKDIEKEQYDKYYQVKNMTEFNLLKDYIKTNLNPKYAFS